MKLLVNLFPRGNLGNLCDNNKLEIVTGGSIYETNSEHG
jgi:hypothetical protein